MPNKRRINLSLSDELVERLGEEENMSGTTETALRNHFEDL